MAEIYPPNCYDYNQRIIPAHRWDKARYTQAVGHAPFYGAVQRDYDRDHTPKGWPPGTEYQYAYCSNYRPILERCQTIKPKIAYMDAHETKQTDNDLHKLYKKTPMGIADKRFTGGHYHIDDPIGVIKNQDITYIKDTALGPVKMTSDETMMSQYQPLYRYKDWVDRPPEELQRDLESISPVCRFNPLDTKYYDFYNEVRMHRPKKDVLEKAKYTNCRTFPIPIDKDFPYVPPVRAQPHLGKFNKDMLESTHLEDGKIFSHHKQDLQARERITCHLTNPIF